MATTFETVILGFGNNTGIEVPAATLSALGGGKRPPVVVTIGEFARQVAEAKAEETRDRRIAKVLDSPYGDPPQPGLSARCRGGVGGGE